MAIRDRETRAGRAPHRPATVLAFGALLLLIACRSEAVPRGYGPLQLGAKDQCPDVNGRFDATEPLVRWSVVEAALPYDTARGPVDAFSLLGNADQSLRLVAWADRVARDTVRLTRNVQYRCSEGRLIVDLPERLPDEIRETIVHPEGNLVRGNRLALALGADGALVADLAHETYEGVSVWCGDGCKYVPIPFSARTAHSWTRADALPEDGRSPSPRAPSSRARQRLERLRAEEQALEDGRPLPGTGAADQLRRRADEQQRAVEMGAPPR